MTKYLFPIQWPVWWLLYFSAGQCSCPQGVWDHAAVNLWNTKLHRSNSMAWPEPGRLPDLGEAAEVCVIAARFMTLTSCSARLIEEWEHFHQVFIDEAIRQWCPHLRACIWAHGGYFEHGLQLCLIWYFDSHTSVRLPIVDTFVLGVASLNPL